MHKTFISYQHSNEQTLKETIIEQSKLKDEFIDKSVSDGDISPDLSEETIMSKIRTEYIQDSSVMIVLIGEETAQRPYINSEIQAGLWGDNPVGLIGVVRDELYDMFYTNTVCHNPECACGVALLTPTVLHNEKLPFLVKENNVILEHGKCIHPHYLNSDAYCSVYRYSDFINNIEKYVDESYQKRNKLFEIKKKNVSGIKTIRHPFG